MKLNIFDKKESKHVPVAEVEGMLRTGTPEAVIRSRLKDEKYSAEDINKAIEQAKIKVGATGIPEQLKPPWEQVGGAPQAPQAPQGKPGKLGKQGKQAIPAQVPSFPPPGPGKQPNKIPPAPSGIGTPLLPEKPPWEKDSPGKYSIQDLESVIQPLMEGLKIEMDSKLDKISTGLKKVSETEKKLETIVKELEDTKTKLAKISESKGQLGDYDEELAQLKGSVNTILEILKGTLPPVIKTLRELKGEKVTAQKKKKQVEHLI